MQKGDAIFTSRSEEWATPWNVFRLLDCKFGKFELDPCATADNAKCERFYTKEQNGLTLPWDVPTFCNPPYGRTIGQWMQKAYESHLEHGVTVCCLVHARTDTRWFHDWAIKGEVHFIKGRIAFNNAQSAPFPSIAVVYGNDAHHRLKTINLKNELSVNG